jgi:hypothetical protein
MQGREPPELKGRYRDREARVEVLKADPPRKGPVTRVTIRLRRESPLRIKIRREGTLRVLGQLARVGFRPSRLDPADAFTIEGDKGRVKDLVTRDLQALFSAEEEWSLFVEGSEAAIEHPGIITSSAPIQKSLNLLLELAGALER